MRFDNVIYNKNHLTKSIDFASRPIAESECMHVLICDGNLVVKKTDSECSIYFSYDEIASYELSHQAYLGNDDLNNHYLSSVIDSVKCEMKQMVSLKELPFVAGILDHDLGMASQALSLANWHSSHQFCANCGAKTVIAQNGWRRDCPSCGKLHFPRIDPVVIMLVTRGDFTLLASGHDFSEKRYSCLAGFVEPGETIEAAALRELYEEASISADNVKYLFSQPWAFPYTLMLGVQIEVTQKEMTLDNNEIKDAIWVRKDDVKALLNAQKPLDITLPPRSAIANALLAHWVDG